MTLTKETDDFKNPALEVRRRLQGSQGRQKVSEEIRQARTELHKIHLIARKHGWHNADPVAVRAACRSLDNALFHAGIKLGTSRPLRG